MTNIQMTIFGVAFIFIMNTIGAAFVFLFKKNINEKYNTIFSGFASGIMIAAAVWSMLLPAIEQAEIQISLPWIPAVVGVILGALFLCLVEKLVNVLKKDKNTYSTEKIHHIKKSTKLFLAVTIHNIPEGLAVGFAFGLAFVTNESHMFLSALGLAIGIGVQNLPEGAAVTLPLKNELESKKKAFIYGTLSGAVEPVFAVVGIFLATQIEFLMPWLLSFAAGAMLYVVIEELIPEAHSEKYYRYGTWSAIFGFIVMMILDVALG